MKFSVERLGEAALVAAADAEPSLEIQRRMWALARAARSFANVSDAVAGDGNVTVLFDPEAIDAGAVETALRASWIAGDRLDSGPAANVELPVSYGGDDGADLAEVARACGMTERDVVARHRAAEYVVWFVGFVPGFAYLHGLDSRLHVPRRSVPRTSVPAGSVAIGGTYTGVYPTSTPGGWNVIGRTNAALFDPAAASPTLLLPGDRVRFVDAAT